MSPDHERGQRIAALEFDPEKREQELVSVCNLCASQAFAEISRTDRYGYPVRLWLCRRCGLGFLSPRLTRREYAAFYQSTYRPLVSAYHGRQIDPSTVQVEQRAYGRDLTAFLSVTLPAAPATILDVGGSTGVVAAAIRDQLGGDVTVLDPSPEELAVASAAGMETVPGFVEDFDPGSRRWDLVLLCQTADHLLDANATFAAMRRLVGDTGRLFVDILDAGFMVRRRGVIEGAVKIDHPYYFTRETAHAYAAQSGFDIVAERLSDDGHWGFLLAPGVVRELEWERLASARDSFLAAVSERRARS